MKRRYYDLFVDYGVAAACPEKLISHAKDLGLHGLGIAINCGALESDLPGYRDLIKTIDSAASMIGVDVVTRLHVGKGVTVGLAKKVLKQYRRYFEVISIENLDRSLTAFACRDSRVDILTVRPPVKIYRGDLDNLASTGGSIEILLCQLQAGTPQARAEALHYYAELLQRLSRRKLVDRLILSSGALEMGMMRDPRDMAALLSVIGLGKESALNAVSSTPSGLVERNRLKLKGLIPLRGVRIIDKGENG